MKAHGARSQDGRLGWLPSYSRSSSSEHLTSFCSLWAALRVLNRATPSLSGELVLLSVVGIGLGCLQLKNSQREISVFKVGETETREREAQAHSVLCLRPQSWGMAKRNSVRTASTEHLAFSSLCGQVLRVWHGDKSFPGAKDSMPAPAWLSPRSWSAWIFAYDGSFRSLKDVPLENVLGLC